jgi:hypothetical protein
MLLPCDLQAQGVRDTAALPVAAGQAIEDYHHFIGTQTSLYTGTEYIGYPPAKGNAWFGDQGLAEGAVVYDGVLYPHVRMLYDIVKDEVVISNPDGNLITLASDKIAGFSLEAHHFIRTTTGFYEQLFAGSPTILAKRTKVLEESIYTTDLIRTFTQKDQYYALKAGASFRLSNMEALLVLLKDKKKEITRYLRDNNIRYKKDKEKALIEAARFYNNSAHL